MLGSLEAWSLESPSLRRLIVLVKILKCLQIIKVIFLKFTVVKSLKLNKNTEYTSESPTKFAFAILLHVVCLFSFYFHFQIKFTYLKQ